MMPETQSTPPELETIKEFCAAMNISEPTFHRQVKLGNIGIVKFGNITRIPMTERQAFIDRMLRPASNALDNGPSGMVVAAKIDGVSQDAPAERLRRQMRGLGFVMAPISSTEAVSVDTDSQQPGEVVSVTREGIMALRDALQAAIAAGDLRECAQDIPIEHSFIPGGYARQITIPAGALLVGKIHRYPCFNFVMKGRITVLTEGGVKEITAPAFFSSPAGVKRVGYTHEETVFITVHATDETNVSRIEDALTVPDYAALEAALKIEGDL